MRAIVALVALAGCGRIGFDASTTAPDADLSICGPAYLTVPNLPSRYRVVTSARSWMIAELDCESDGGHLVVVESFLEDDWVSGQVAGWIGTSDHITEGTFVHVTGQPLTFTNWQGTEPSNSNNIEDCVQHRDDREWNDGSCGNARQYVCECDGLKPVTPPTWCDTSSSASCGECGTACTGGDSCNSQVCSDPS